MLLKEKPGSGPTDVLPDARAVTPTSDVIEAFHPSEGYGTDPNLVTPESPWKCTLTCYHRHVLAALADIILPGADGRKKPSEVGITDFLDEWLSAPYDRQLSDRSMIVPGLELVDDLARSVFSCDFLDLNTESKQDIVARLASADELARRFFVKLRFLIVGGYYTTDVGSKELGYVGNLPLKEQDEILPEVKVALRRTLAKLGLK